MRARKSVHAAIPPALAGGASSVVEILRRRAEARPQERAYSFLADGETEEQRLTWGELDARARAVAARLQSEGAEGERVLLTYPPGLEFLSAFLGCLYAGAVAVTTHLPRLRHSLGRLQSIVADAGAKFVLAPPAVLAQLDSFAGHAPALRAARRLATDLLDAEQDLADAWRPPGAGPETLAFLQYTSGSTSTPKGVMVTHGNILHNSAEINAAYEFTPDAVSLVWVPHFHDMGLIMGLLQPLVHGFPGLLMPPASFLQRPVRWLAAVSRYGVTHTGGPNSAYDLCVRRTTPEQRAALDLSSWRVAYNGAEPIHPATLERFAEAFAPCGFRWEAFNPGYGLAEATLVVTRGRRADAPVLGTFSGEALLRNRVAEAPAGGADARRLVSSGHAAEGAQVRIVNPETSAECAPEEIGEVWVAGPSVAAGYWGRPAETRETFRALLAGTDGPHFLRTGDLGFLRGGELFVTGRLKDLIIVGGRNHYPQDIEKTVEECHPALRRGCCAAFSLETEGGERLAVVVEVERESRRRLEEAEDIFAAVRRAVADEHELNVAHVALLRTGKILKTTSGKIQRRACRDEFLKGTLEVVAEWPPPPEDAKRGAGAEESPAASPARGEVEAWLVERLAALIHVAPQEVDVLQPFAAFGLGSMQSVSLSGELADWLGRALPATLLYEYPTVAALSKFLAGEAAEARVEEATAPDAADACEPVAIVGIGCRFPGADGPEAFWRLLREGGDAVSDEAPARGGPNGAAVKHRGGFLEGVELFDAPFFSVSPREAPFIDPQQRLLLEVAWEALEHAGHSPAKLAGSRTGVFVGISNSDYRLLHRAGTEGRAPYAPTGTSHSIAANRLSYFFDFQGPSVAVDTACSSSLVAVHLACESLRRGESSMALAGGVNLVLDPSVTEDLARAGMLSPDGRCKVFDAGADGYVRAEGCGLVVLKPLSAALRDGDHVVALIRGSAINQDGRSNGLTAPNGLAQQAVVRRALKQAGVAPPEINFVETHGSGTSLGDPIEVNSLVEVLGEGRTAEQPCLLGSVKANIGHLEAAAGVAGLIKAALALRHAEVPPQLHLRSENPHLKLGGPFSVPTRAASWPGSAPRRLAGVSSFGFGGTNAHVVLEGPAPDDRADEAPERPWHVLTLSARSEGALRESARRYAAFLRERADVSLADVCFTAGAGRTHFRHRLAVVCGSRQECAERLEAFVSGRESVWVHVGRAGRERPKLAPNLDGEEVPPAEAARLYVEGADVDWEGFGAGRRRVPLPTYPFERRRYWLDAPKGSAPGEVMPDTRHPAEAGPAAASQHNGKHHDAAPAAGGRQREVRQRLSGIIAELLGMPVEELDPHAPFLEMGADSIVLVTAIRTIENSFGVRISIRQLFEDLTTIDALAAHLAAHARADAPEGEAPQPTPAPTPPEPRAEVVAERPAPVEAPAAFESAAEGSDIERIFKMQLDAFARLTAQQLETVKRGGAATAPPARANGQPPPDGQGAAARAADPSAASQVLAPAPYVPYKRLTPGAGGGLSERQSRHLAGLVARYTRRTQRSKELARGARARLADSRASVGFRLSVKEMLYPLTGAGSAGARLWDVDGNEYVDVTMGFGVHLFGHRPAFVQEALEEQLRAGIQLGPRVEAAGEVAALFCELTGHERAAFCNSGTEAVMTALRLARAATGRTRIAIFSGSYHGHSDGTLAIAEHAGGELASVPMAPGVPSGVAGDVVVLEYGSPSALDYLRAHARELACVLVEPVQSRNPGLQPREFLRELRAVTEAAGAALVFDEMVTGFRVHPGGAQAWFGVEADLATYGKVVGGGLPIGVVAGRASFMDGIDGGAWDYGDASYPRAETTFFGGTFCMHPLAMAAARATLAHLRREGPELQEGLNRRADAFAARLNSFFEESESPLRVANFGSLFRFIHSGNMDLFYYHLLEKGVYIWEWRSCFLSTAHTEDDLARVFGAVAASVGEMRDGGFIPPRSGGPSPARPEKQNGHAASGLPASGAGAAAGAAHGFWDRSGVKPALVAPQTAARVTPRAEGVTAAARAAGAVEFSLYYFGKYRAEFDERKYDLLLEGARFADRRGFKALWVPERHFHPFGGLSPNPSVLAAALARETSRIHLRAGSVVLPLHHPVRVAEEWALVDNLSRGRAGVSFASGWHPDDFVLAPEAYGRHRELMFERIEEVRRLWRGEQVSARGGAGNEVDVRLFPRPMQRELPVWVTVVNNPETCRRAGAIGAGILTNLMGQSVEDLARNVELYRRALAEHGHDPARGHVAVLLHAFVGADAEAARARARRPFYEYLESSLGLFQNLVKSQHLDIDMERLSADDLEYILASAYERYVATSALIGSPGSCAPVVESLARVGVDEVACLVDFGVEAGAVLEGLPHLDELRALYQPPAAGRPGAEVIHLTPAPAGGVPLTEAQKQLWLLAQMDEGAELAYHETVAVELTGPLDHALLREAFRATAARHEALRAAVSPDGESQLVAPSVELEVPLVELEASPGGDKQSAAEAWLSEEVRRPFDLTRAPLLRVNVLRLEDERHVLVLAAHHIIIDSWSLGLILNEVAALYSAGRGGAAPELPAPMPFGRYVEELARPDYLELLRGHEAYWLGQLSGQPPALALTTHRPPVKRYRGAKVGRLFDADLCARLKAYSRRNGCTLFMTLFAGYSALLHRLSRQESVVVGIPVSGRFVEGSESVVGYCTHLLPVLSRLDPADDFDAHLRASRGLLLGAYEHQEYPFAALIRLLNPARDLSRTPVIQTTFNLEPHTGLPAFGGLRAALAPTPACFAKFDVSVNVLELEGELRVDFDYDADLLDAAFVERMADQFRMLLEGALSHAGEPIAALPLMTEAERRRLLYEWNDTAAPVPDVCVHELLEASARRAPGAAAVVCGAERLTYAELNRRADRVARRLRGLGLGAEARVAVCAERSASMLAGLLGVLKAGCAYVPLDPEYPRERLAYMLEDSRAAALLTTRELSGLFPSDAPRVVELDDITSDVGAEDDEDPGNVARPDNLAYVIYTSGSTGKPKGVAVTHAAAVNLLASMRRRPGLEETDALLAVTTFSFDIAALELFLPLMAGARLHLATREEAKDGERLARMLAEHRISVMQATPATWRLLVAAGWQGTEGLKVLCGGEALPRELAGELLARGASLWNMYGPTETTIWSGVERVEAGGGAVPVGRPIDNTQFFILDAQLQPVAPGLVGELFIGGAGLARGYHARPAQTAEKFIPHPFSPEPGARLYRTGDLARHRADGKVELLGRVDSQVKLRGYRIELGEVEAALGGHDSVREAVAAVREDRPGDQRLVAYVVGEAGRRPDARELSAFLGQTLPEYMIPSAYVALDALPRHPNGKVNRGALPAPAVERAPDAGAAPRTGLEQTIAAIWRDVLRLPRVGLYENFFDLGGHSLLLTQVHRRLKEATGSEFPVVEMFRHPTVAALAGFLSGGARDEATPAELGRRAPARRDVGAGNDVAVIGLTGRFPGAANASEFWRNLREGVESVTFFSDEELGRQGVAPAVLGDPRYVKASAVLEGVEEFDAAFFGFSPREAEVTDPQHRLFLECAWEALEDAGYDSERAGGAVGVYAAVGLNSYLLFNLAGRLDPFGSTADYQTFIGNDKDFVPTRVSYKLNLRGPSVNVQTACSSSLVAVHLACRSLLDGECDMALAGGVAVKLPLRAGYLHDEQGIDSPDGHCRAFDAKAGGTVFGSGVGVVVLKRLEDALRDGDHVRAVIRGTAVNNDGSHKVSYTAPSVDGQAEVISEALSFAGVGPETVSYVEAHGTGTRLGDPVEVAALARAFATNPAPEHRCALGSVKTNVGHLDTAAGVAGLIKTVLALEHKELPPSLHFESPNPEIDFARGPFYVNERLRPWAAGATPRRAGVSSFGIGGTNAHVVLEEAPAPEESGGSRPWQLLTLSARTETALEAATAALAGHLRTHPEASLADVAYTLQTGRRPFGHRRVVVCRSAAEAAESLERRDSKRVFTLADETRSRPVAFLFPGQGTQYVGMARGLYEAEADFRETVDECAEILRPHLGLDLRDVLYPAEAKAEEAARLLNETRLAQPALFVVEYALGRLWAGWGVRPAAMLGHSVGEYAAACLAGVLTLAEGLALVAARGRLMQALPPGSMLALSLAEGEARALLDGFGDGRLALAAVNGPAQVVVSGETATVEELEAELRRRGLRATRLRTSHAFHSAMMEPALEAFAREAARVRFEPPRVPYISSLTGDWITDAEATDPQYWVRQLRETVRFADGLEKLLAEPQRLLLEVGPGQSLGAQLRRHPQRRPEQHVVSTTRHEHDPEADAAVLTTALGRLWLAGADVAWPSFYARERRRRTPLPTYPFERQRYWVEPTARRAEAEDDAPLSKNPDPSRWFYLPYWKPSAPPAPGGDGRGATPLLVFANEHPLCLALLRRLAERGDHPVTVRAGEQFAQTGERQYELNARSAADYRGLFEELRRHGALPGRVLHLWSLGADEGPSPAFESYRHTGVESLLKLGKVLGEAAEAAELFVFSNHLHDVTGADEVRPEKATLLAPCKTLPQEYPHLSCRSVDLDAPAPGSLQERRLTTQLLAELEAETSDAVVAYRDGARWVQSFAPAPLGAHAGGGIQLKQGGVYLITGGLGKVGLALAAHLASATRGRLALVGRTPFPRREEWAERSQAGDETAGKIRRLLAIEAAGAQVLVCEADVTDAEQLRSAFARAEEEFGRVDGVVHAAGFVPEQTFQLVRDADEAVADWPRNPKLQGLFVLEEVVRGRGADFCLVTSSLASVLGGIGYTSYCAANLCADAFARRQNRRGTTPWISVNWDAWTFEDEPPREGGVGAALAAMSLTPAEGAEACRRILAAGPFAQVVVSTADLRRRLARWINPRPDRAEAGRGAAAHPRPAPAATYVAPSTETERWLAELWQQLLGIETVGVRDDFFALGGDSLLAVQLTSRLRAALGAEVGPRDLFESPTVAALARLIEGRGAVGETAGDAPPLRRASRDGVLPLSSAQQRLWAVCQLGRGETAYNVPTATLLRGPLDVAALERCLNEIVRRHETLRTSFPAVEGRPLAVIAPSVTLSLPVVEVDGGSPEERRARALELARAEAQEPFDLSRGPLLRARLLRAGPDEHVLVLTMHHIVTDGWSMGVLIGEVAALYEAFSKGAPSPLPELRAQYFDFAEWERQALGGERLARLLDYWKRQLGGGPPRLELPTDRPRDAVQTFRGATLPVALAPELAGPLKALALGARATLYMTLLAAFKVLLGHHARAERVAVGADVANRTRPESEPLIGFFVNQLVLLTDLSGDPTFGELLARVRETSLGAFAHQELPFDLLVDALKPEREAADSPLFRAKFVLQNAPQPPIQLSDLNITPLEVENFYAKFDLLLTLWESGDGLRGTFEYRAELFDPDTVEGMLLDYEIILRAVARDAGVRLSALGDLLSRVRRERTHARERQMKEAARSRLRGARRRPLSAGTE